MKIIVTGASGQLGREIVRRSCSSGHAYVFTDVRPGQIDVCGNVHYLESMDITCADDVARIVTPDVDVVINCAAYTDVNAAETEHELAEKVNVIGPSVLSKAAAAAGAVLIHISTDYIFDGQANKPYTEEDAPHPLSCYGMTKLRAEQEIMSSGCRYMIFRTSWLYSNHGKNFFLTMERLTAERPEIKVVNDQTGTPTSACDLASLIHHIIENGMLDKTGVYNYSNEGACTWYDFAREINDLLWHICRVIPCPTSEYPSPAVRPAYSVLDKTKVKETFGIEVPHWKDSLRHVVQEYHRQYE